MSAVKREGPAARQQEPVAGTQTISRTFTILRVFRDAATEMGVTEVARALDLHTSTVHRIVRALVTEGYLVQNEESDRYHLGREAVLLGQAAQRFFGLDLALPVLERLFSETGESVNLVVRDDDAALVVLRIDSQLPLRFSQPPGSRIPLYATSTGKALLAFGGDVEADLAALGELRRLTPRTLTSPERLLDEAAAIRTRGYSVNEGESVPGVCGVAAPVIGADGTATAAVAVQGPEVRMPAERIAELGPRLVELAQEIAELLPYARRV